MRFARLALKVVTQNDRDFVGVILLYLSAGGESKTFLLTGIQASDVQLAASHCSHAFS